MWKSSHSSPIGGIRPRPLRTTWATASASAVFALVNSGPINPCPSGPWHLAQAPAKAQRIHRLAGLWLAERSGPWVPVRFDVVEVVIADGRGPLLSHLRAAF